VKLRGYRIELGEIESELQRHQMVEQSVVAVKDHPSGDKRLVAYILFRGQQASASELRSFLQKSLPDYMVPSFFLAISSLPLLPNGKLNRAALPMPEWNQQAPGTAFVAPRTVLELQLSRIWEDVLEISPIGVKNNFFELGGHSIMAVRLMARIQQDFEQKLPLAKLFEAATVENLAIMLQERIVELPWSPLVSIQPRGNRRPIFCVHPMGGSVLCFYQLSRFLGNEQPFYGLQAPDISEVAAGGADDYRNIEERAAAYVEAIRRVQPEGPYLLGGYSFGSTVAFEMAQQLKRQKQEVALLAHFDSIAPLYKLDIDDTSLLILMAQEMVTNAGRTLPLAKEELAGMSPDEQLTYILEKVNQTGILPPDINPEIAISWTRSTLEGGKIRSQALHEYRPEIYDGPITLFRTKVIADSSGDLMPEEILNLHLSNTHGWAQLTTRPVEVIPVEGNHETLLSEPHVTLLAQRLQECIDQIEAR